MLKGHCPIHTVSSLTRRPVTCAGPRAQEEEGEKVVAMTLAGGVMENNTSAGHTTNSLLVLLTTHHIIKDEKHFGCFKISFARLKKIGAESCHKLL